MGNTNSERKVKCVVWDLDQTLWNGILIEDEIVEVNPIVKETIIELDKRGILQSIASKNNSGDAIAKLKELQLDQYFIYPQINWDEKSKSIQKIAQLINIGIDTLAFIDDQEFELDEVRFHNPEVLCIKAAEVPELLKREEFMPRFLTEDSKRRRKMYQDDIRRKEDEEQFQGTQIDFLKTLHMEVEIALAKEEDLKRVEELTIRTHQLNSTGYTYSYEELKELIHDDRYKLYIVNLKDRYGDYGRIGIVLIKLLDMEWRIQLFLFSCRVMSRGIGSIVLNYLKRQTKEKGIKLSAEFRHTDKNRMMYTMLMFNGFHECEPAEDGYLVCEDYEAEDDPDYVTITRNMGNRVLQKVMEPPLVLSNNECAHLLLMLNDYRETEAYQNWLLQNFFTIYVVRRDMSEFENVICFLPDIEERVLARCPFIKVDYLLSDQVTDVVKEVKGWIDAGRLVILPLNKFYLPNASEYQKMEITHRVLVYGYDDESETFEAADMFKLTGYTMELVKYDALKEAYTHSEPMKQDGSCELEIISLAERECELDLPLLREKIEQYVEQNAEFESSEVFQALDRSLQQEDYLDEISCNVLYEYQRMITRKAEILAERKLIRLEEEQMQEFMQLESEMKQLRNYFIKYRIKSRITPIVEERNKIHQLLQELHTKHIRLYQNLLKTLQ